MKLIREGMKLPKIGLRNVKTAFSATFCAGCYLLIGRNATFACIGAVFGMEGDGEHPWRSGGNRLAGTVIGGLTGMGLFYLNGLLDGKIWETILLFVGIIFLIYISQLLHFPGAVQAGSVVFYIVMLNTPLDQYISYPLNRMLDTAIGVIVSVMINVLFSRQRIERWKEYFKTVKSNYRK